MYSLGTGIPEMPTTSEVADTMRAIVDQDVCIGTGACEGTCPRVFKVVDGKSQVQADPIPDGEEKKAKKAADFCPVSAISVEE